jgi:ubiquinone/menaquinone biosynthesis C-methylase UbiE
MTERLQEQYATDQNLRARISLHAAYSVNGHWFEWLFDREAPGPGARILDLGCGPATLWRVNSERVDASWSLTLADLSAGMIEAARNGLGERATYVVTDAQELPFPAGSFDIVIANHMLYHVPDRPRAFAEFRRVLVPGGAFHASTNGRGHLAELAALIPGQNEWSYVEAFGLETGPEQLEPFFADIRVERFADALAVTEAEPVLAYIRSTSRYRGEDLTSARRTVEAAIARDGAFHVTKSQGVISCRRPQPGNGDDTAAGADAVEQAGSAARVRELET